MMVESAITGGADSIPRSLWGIALSTVRSINAGGAGKVHVFRQENGRSGREKRPPSSHEDSGRGIIGNGDSLFHIYLASEAGATGIAD